MPISPLAAVQELLKRSTVLGDSASETIAYLMDLLYYGEFQIFEQVASTEDFDYINLVGIKGQATQEPPLWLVSNLSTGGLPVPSNWESTGGNPYAPTVDEEHGMLYGLGAASGKVDLLLKLLAASRFRSEELIRPIYVVAMLGDEGRSTGIRSLLGMAHTVGGCALLGAPTNLNIWTEHPGVLAFDVAIHRRVRHRRMPPTRGIFELEITGATSHAQVRELGDDALEKARDTITRLREAGDIRILSIQAGGHGIQVPGSCKLCVATGYDDLPPLPEGVTSRPMPDGAVVPFPIDDMVGAWFDATAESIEKISPLLRSGAWGDLAQPPVLSHIGSLDSERDAIHGSLLFWTPPGVSTQEIAETVAGALERRLAREEELEGAIRVIQDRKALSPTADSKFLAATKDALRDIDIPPSVSQGYVTTDAGLLMEAGVQALAFGPGTGVNTIYRDNESMPVAHIEACYRF